MAKSRVFVGIDVAQATLEVAVRPSGESWQVANDEVAFGGLVERLRQFKPSLIVLEATGGFHLSVVAALAAAKLPVVAVNPRQARDFAKATGKLPKTDRIDAQVLAHFAEAVRPEVRHLPDAATHELAVLVARRRQLMEMRVAEQNRSRGTPARIRSQIREHVELLIRDNALAAAALLPLGQARLAGSTHACERQQARGAEQGTKLAEFLPPSHETD